MSVENTERKEYDLITGNLVKLVLLMSLSVLKPVESVRYLRTAAKIEGELIKFFISLLMLIILLYQKRYLPRCVPSRLPKWILCRTQTCKWAIHSLGRRNCRCLLWCFFSLALKLISRSRAFKGGNGIKLICHTSLAVQRKVAFTEQVYSALPAHSPKHLLTLTQKIHNSTAGSSEESFAFRVPYISSAGEAAVPAVSPRQSRGTGDTGGAVTQPGTLGSRSAHRGRRAPRPAPPARSQPSPDTSSLGAGGAPGTCGVLWLSPPWRFRRCCGSWAAEPGSPRWPERTAPPSLWTHPPPRRCTGPAGRASCWRRGRWLSARCPPRRRCRRGQPASCSWWAGRCGAARRPRCAACWSRAPCGTACWCAATRRRAVEQRSWRRPCSGGWARAAVPRWCCGTRRSWRPSRRSSACCPLWQRSSRRCPAPAAPAPQRSG